VVLFEKLDRCGRFARAKSLCDDRGTHVGRQLSEGAHDIRVATFDVTRILESTHESRPVSEKCTCAVAVRDDERTERRQSDRNGSEDSGALLGRRFGCHQTCESALLNTLR
jgi:hypothetical protein